MTLEMPPPIALLGAGNSDYEDAVVRAGGVVVPLDADPLGIVLAHNGRPEDLFECIDSAASSVRWVQLPSAGVERFNRSLAVGRDIVWTSAKGAYAKPVAEHALALVLAALRLLPQRARAQSWGEPGGRSLHGLRVVVLGGGGVAAELIRLLRPFETEIVVVRRSGDPMGGAHRTRTFDAFPEEARRADVLVLAAALTEETRGAVDESVLSGMKQSAVVVNVGRGPLIDTEALARSLRERRICAAALDVTDPEPLPDGHPLWSEEACVITPHTADTMDMMRPLYIERIEHNVDALANDGEFIGLVDIAAGY